jgi:hypothetical protein
VFVAAATTANGFDTTDKQLSQVLVATQNRAIESSAVQHDSS